MLNYHRALSLRQSECRKNVSLCRHTHAAQHAPPSLCSAASKFHAKLFRVRRRGKFELSDIANMDQTSLPFVLDEGKTYNNKGEKEIWCATAPSGFDKRQCTVQLTIFADGKPHVRPTIIFRGQGKRRQKKMHGIQGYVSCFKRKLGVTRQS